MGTHSCCGGRVHKIGYASPITSSRLKDISFPETTMAIETVPLPLPPTADPSKFKDFGREVRGVHPGRLTDEEFKEIEQLLYKVRVVPSISRISSCLLARRAARRTPLQERRSLARGTVQPYEGTSDNRGPEIVLTLFRSPSRLSTLRAISTVTVTTKPRKTPNRSSTLTSRRSLEFLKFSLSETVPFMITRVSPKLS